MDVDEARRDHQSCGVDLPMRVPGVTPGDRADASIRDRDIGRAGRSAAAVDHLSAAYQEFVHRRLPP